MDTRALIPTDLVDAVTESLGIVDADHRQHFQSRLQRYTSTYVWAVARALNTPTPGYARELSSELLTKIDDLESAIRAIGLAEPFERGYRAARRNAGRSDLKLESLWEQLDALRQAAEFAKNEPPLKRSPKGREHLQAFIAAVMALIENTTQVRPLSHPMDGRLPITLECAKKIGDIMKYVDMNEKPQVSYSFYM